MSWELLLMTGMGAFIGWITNRIAIRMLFRPYRPWGIGRFSLQGLLPARQQELARVVGETVAKELLPQDKLASLFTEGPILEQMAAALGTHVSLRLEEKLPKFLPGAVRQYLIGEIVQAIDREFRGMLPGVVESVQRVINEEVNVAKIIEETILGFDLRELERLVLSVVSTELRYIELWGMVLGGLLGLTQWGLRYLPL